MAGRRKTATRRKSASRVVPRKHEARVRRGGVGDYFKFSESYTSLILGIVVVIIATVLLISFLRGREFGKVPQAPEISSTKIEPEATSTPATGEEQLTPTVEPTRQVVQKTPTLAPTAPPQPQVSGKGTYTVQAGDDLWHIAEKVYKDGYKWTLIAQANDITNPGMIFKGDVLKIPDVSQIPSQQPEPGAKGGQQSAQPTAIVGNRYTIRRGDTLWSIAERRYNNGYRWVNIAKANSLTNPDLIHADNVLQLPN
ncbi:MAG: LysM peptidoglycan-binding domain-containing protein [Candidatus Levybacteria bacterium]|nr:LysM peptidoglycan-binding domain-containing protein [Candidatus Levybacteria bacterium]